MRFLVAAGTALFSFGSNTLEKTDVSIIAEPRKGGDPRLRVLHGCGNCVSLVRIVKPPIVGPSAITGR